MPTFEQGGRSRLAAEIAADLKVANHWADYNAGWDLRFKIVLGVLGILSAAGAGLAGTLWKDNVPALLTIINILIGALITGLSAFAFAQLNFPARTELYRKKAGALQALLLYIQFSNPEQDTFLTALARVRAWNESTPQVS